MNHSLIGSNLLDRAGESFRPSTTLEILPVIINIVLDLFEDVLSAGEAEEMLEDDPAASGIP